MSFSVSSSPHLIKPRSLGQLMRLVIYAMVPGILLQTWFFGWGVIIQLSLCIVTAIICEACMLELRNKNFEMAIKDCSALVTAMLIGVSIPPLAPWWLAVSGTLFAIMIVKQLYGGIGFNLFNPAMAAYVMLLISFPVHMTAWATPVSLTALDLTLLDAFSLIFTGFSTEGYSLAQMSLGVDGLTMATPLDQVKTSMQQGLTFNESLNAPTIDGASGIGWFWVNVAYLLGGYYLIRYKVINWHIPVGMILGLLIPACIFYWLPGEQLASPWFHLFSGGFMLGAFFIATDPVTASTTNKGRILFGLGIGLLVYLIRSFGGYPDAIAFAVLLMNMTVPLLDYFTQPRTYGHAPKKLNLAKRLRRKQD